MTKEQLIGMLGEGLNLNQIASIYTINKEKLEMLLTEEATTVSPTGASGKTKVSTIKTTSAGGTEGTSGGSGIATNSTSGWQNEEGL
jgi:hypothetical protein